MRNVKEKVEEVGMDLAHSSAYVWDKALGLGDIFPAVKGGQPFEQWCRTDSPHCLSVL